MAQRRHEVRNAAVSSARAKAPANPQKEINRLRRQLREARRQQAATADILKIISRSATGLKPVLDAIVETASRLCDSDWAVIRMLGADGMYHTAAAHSAKPEFLAFIARHPIVPGRGSAPGRALVQRRTVHVPDVLKDPEYSTTQREAQRIGGFRSSLAGPCCGTASRSASLRWLAPRSSPSPIGKSS